jgi:hypothetical protein
MNASNVRPDTVTPSVSNVGWVSRVRFLASVSRSAVPSWASASVGSLFERYRSRTLVPESASAGDSSQAFLQPLDPLGELVALGLDGREALAQLLDPDPAFGEFGPEPGDGFAVDQRPVWGRGRSILVGGVPPCGPFRVDGRNDARVSVASGCDLGLRRLRTRPVSVFGGVRLRSGSFRLGFGFEFGCGGRRRRVLLRRPVGRLRRPGGRRVRRLLVGADRHIVRDGRHRRFDGWFLGSSPGFGLGLGRRCVVRFVRSGIVRVRSFRDVLVDRLGQFVAVHAPRPARVLRDARIAPVGGVDAAGVVLALPVERLVGRGRRLGVGRVGGVGGFAVRRVVGPLGSDRRVQVDLGSARRRLPRGFRGFDGRVPFRDPPVVHGSGGVGLRVGVLVRVGPIAPRGPLGYVGSVLLADRRRPAVRSDGTATRTAGYLDRREPDGLHLVDPDLVGREVERLLVGLEPPGLADVRHRAATAAVVDQVVVAREDVLGEFDVAGEPAVLERPVDLFDGRLLRVVLPARLPAAGGHGEEERQRVVGGLIGGPVSVLEPVDRCGLDRGLVRPRVDVVEDSNGPSANHEEVAVPGDDAPGELPVREVVEAVVPPAERTRLPSLDVDDRAGVHAPNGAHADLIVSGPVGSRTLPLCGTGG